MKTASCQIRPQLDPEKSPYFLDSFRVCLIMMAAGLSDEQLRPATHRHFGIAVVVTLVLNVGGPQNLQLRVGLAEVLHRHGHVQRGDPSQGTESGTKPVSHNTANQSTSQFNT